MSDLDLSAYLDLFKEDVAEHLQRMSEGLLALEADPANRQPVDDLFRAAHTVKGSARMMGLGEIAALAHRMEDVLSAFRGGQLPPTSGRVSALFSGLDLLKRMVDTAGADVPPPPEYAQVIERLQQALDPAAGLDQPPSAARGATEPMRAGGAEAAEAPRGSSPASPGVRQRESVRVPVGRVDQILNLASELAIRRQTSHRHAQALKELAGQARRVAELLQRADPRAARSEAAHLAERLDHLAREQRAEARWRAEIVADLHTELTRIRMLPLSTVFGVFYRTVRDLSLQRGKEVRLVVEGGEIEMDKLILEGLHEPLLHLVRNAIDHGIEPPDRRVLAGKPPVGTLRLSASQRGNRVEIEVADDGRGLDLDRIRQVGLARGLLAPGQAAEASEEDLLTLLFVPGFSTSEQVTETSGRGVGMDAVRAAVAELSGQVSLQSRPGEGTVCTISLPLTLAYTRALLVEVADQVLAFPSASVEWVSSVHPRQVMWLQGQPAVELGGRTLPIVPLAEALGLAPPRPLGDDQPLVVVRAAGQRLAFAVDRLLGEDDIVAKSLGPLLQEVGTVSSGAILPSGRIALLLNVHHLVRASASGRAHPLRPRTAPEARRILVVDDVATTRELERGLLLAAGFRTDTAVDGLDALQKLSVQTYDAVVTDIEMPRMDGFELVQTLRREERWRSLPVVIVTARENEADRRRGLELGAQAYVLKSAFDQHDLVETLRRLLG